VYERKDSACGTEKDQNIFTMLKKKQQPFYKLKYLNFENLPDFIGI
jgi:hypothetical protein